MDNCPGCGEPVDLETVGMHCMDCDPTGLADLLTKDLHDAKDAVRGLRSAALQVLDLFEGGIYREAHTKALLELERLARP